MLLRKSCRAGKSVSVMLSQICSKTNSLGAKTTLHLELMGGGAQLMHSFRRTVACVDFSI